MKGYLAAGLLLAVLVPASLGAQDQSWDKPQPAIHASLSSSSAGLVDLENAWQGGFGLYAGVEVPWKWVEVGSLDASIFLRGDVGIHLFPFQADGFKEDMNLPSSVDLDGGMLTALSAFVGAGVALELVRIRPYAVLGGGLLTLNVDEIEATGATIPAIELDDQPSLGLALGFSYRLTDRIDVRAEGKALSTFAEDAYAALSLGARYRMPW